MPIWSPAFFGSATSGGYVIEGSGSFNGSDGKLTRTISDAGNRRTFILEVIFKRGGSASSFLTAFSSGTDTFYWYLSSDQVYIQNYQSATQMELKSDAKLRDFSAWYHVIVAIDTTQSTDTNRVKAWVNGVELTFVSSPRTYPTQNLELKWNTGSQEHQIGHSSTTYSDDYFARAASYDGFTMTDPVTNGFGEYDDNGVWVPKNPSDLTGKVLISQGTGSAIGTMDTRTSAAFDGNNNQDENNAASHSSAATTVTLGKDFGSGNAKTVTQVKAFGYSGGGFTSNASENCTITVIGSNTGLGSDEVTLATSGTISDTTDSNPQTISFSNSTAYRYVYIKLTQSPSNYFFVAELEFYEEGTLGFGTTGFLIEGGAAFTNGTDSSGNSQNFTKGGTITDVDDTLTDKASDNFGNFATLSPIDQVQGASTLSKGNLTIVGSGSNHSSTRSTLQTDGSGKFAWEVTVTTHDTNTVIGLMKSSDRTSGGDNIGATANSGWALVNDPGGTTNARSRFAGSDMVTDLGFQLTNGDVFHFELDNSTGDVFAWRKPSGGSFATVNSGNTITAGAGKTALAGTPVLFAQHIYQAAATNSQTYNFGQTTFAQTPSSGYKAVNTANLAAPTVTKPDDFYNTVSFSGTGSAQNIDTVGFQPDLLIIKSRTSTANFNWIDSVRGAANILWSNAATAQSAESTSVTGFRDAGFSVGSDSGSYVNISGQTMVAFCMKAGGSGSSNSSGDITSTVSVASHGGFSIVKYDPGSGGSPGDTVGHGLSRAPNFIILKVLESVGDQNWSVGSDDIGWTNNLFLSLTNAKSAGSGPWNNTAPTSSVFSIGSDRDNDAAYIAYCFAKTPGLIACGTYTGNGSSDGPMVVVDDGGSGFRPAWVMCKRTDSTGNWPVNDAVRSPYNPTNLPLFIDQSAADGSGINMDFIANGFKIRDSSVTFNASGGTYIYLAFAEHPFGGDGVSQGKAR